MSKEVIIQFNDRMHFLEALKENKGVIVVKFSATWCGPCQIIKPLINQQFIECPDDITCCDLDVDDNVDLYSFLKKNKQLNGIPVLLAWFKGNVTPFANLSITGANEPKIIHFFNSVKQWNK